MNHYIRYSVLLLIFLFPILTVSVQHAGSIIYILLILIGIMYGWPTWKQLGKSEKILLLGYCCFTFISVLSLLNADDWPASVRRLERVLRFLAIVPVYLLVRSLKVDVLKSLLAGAGLGCIVLGSHAWYFVTVKHLSSVGGAYNKIIFGDIATLLVVVVAAGLFTVAEKRWHYILASVCIGAGLYASVMSGARGAWLFLPLLLPVLLYMYRHLLSVKRVILLAVSMIFLLATGEYWVPASVAKGFQRGLENIRLYQQDPSKMTSWGARLNMWRDSISLFKQNPILGVGLGDYRLERSKLMKNGLANKGADFDHAHNIYLDSLATTGLMGFLALLLCVFLIPVSLFYTAWRSWHYCLDQREWDRFAILAGICVLFGFAVFGLSEGWLSRNPFLSTYAIFIAVFAASSGRFLSETVYSSRLQPD